MVMHASLNVGICRCLSAVVVVLALAMPGVAEDESPAAALLTIGSPAPPLDIEHWVFADDDSTVPVVQTFDAGQVYVVEFWATWCGPCISSMPHLAKLQESYRQRGVQIISVSDEPLDVVETFLERETKDDAGEPITFRTLTSAYSLTTDPDQSTHQDYMRAAAQNGIPTAFIVGKSGIIEWVGHPARMDEPLEQVVAGSWDREAFAKQFKLRQENDALMQQINQLAASGQPQEALDLIDQRLQEMDAATPERAQLETMRLRVALRSGLLDDQMTQSVIEQLEAADDVMKLQNITQVLASAPSTNPAIKDLQKRARDGWIALHARRVDAGDTGTTFMAHIMLSRLNVALEDWDQAIANLEQAVEAAPESSREAVAGELERLKRRAQAAGDQE